MKEAEVNGKLVVAGQDALDAGLRPCSGSEVWIQHRSAFHWLPRSEYR
jgi:hypothetical protein